MQLVSVTGGRYSKPRAERASVVVDLESEIREQVKAAGLVYRRANLAVANGEDVTRRDLSALAHSEDATLRDLAGRLNDALEAEL